MASTIKRANSEHETFVAPGIMRWKSYVTVLFPIVVSIPVPSSVDGDAAPLRAEGVAMRLSNVTQAASQHGTHAHTQRSGAGAAGETAPSVTLRPQRHEDALDATQGWAYPWGRGLPAPP